MTTEHPITPPPELVQQWLTEGHHQDYCSATNHAIAQAARWGADQELEACCKLLGGCTVIPVDGYANTAQNRLAAVDRVARLRAARRPKPPRLAEEALEEIQQMEGAMYSAELGCDFTATRAALERLQHLEQESNDN